MFGTVQRRPRVGVIVGAVLVAGSIVILAARPAAAAVRPVLGSGYGYTATVYLFGGTTPQVKNPTPRVKLPSGGSATPVTKTVASGRVAFGPAVLFTSGRITLTTVGQSGNAMTTATLDTVGGSPFTADSIKSTCTASNGGAASGSVSVTNGVVVTSTDSNGNPTSTMAVPTNPTANLDISGSFQLSPTDRETFDWVFNEQIHNSNGSLTVNAGHEIMHGPTAKGDLIIGKSLCRS